MLKCTNCWTAIGASPVLPTFQNNSPDCKTLLPIEDHIVSRHVFLKGFLNSLKGVWQESLDEVLRPVLHKKSDEMVLTVLVVSVWKSVRP